MHWLEVNIKLDLEEREWDGAEWIEVAQNKDKLRALLNKVMNFRVP
jgi:hypothetical protein